MGQKLKEKDVERRDGIPVRTLQQMRYYGKGPAYLKVGRSVLYDTDDLDSWLASCRVETAPIGQQAA